MKTLFLVIFGLMVLSIAPLLFIWSLNTMFPVLSIPYTLQTVVAAALVIILFCVNTPKRS